MNRLLLLMTIFVLSGCEPKMDDLQQFIVEVANTPPTVIEPYPEFVTKPAFKYTASELRSPFQRLKSNELEIDAPQIANCRQPDLKKGKMALEKYGIDALSIQGFFTSMGKTWAIVLANDGTLHKVTTGDRMGLFFGEITNISKDVIYYTELLPDGTGCWKEKKSKLTMSQDSGENNNV